MDQTSNKNFTEFEFLKKHASEIIPSYVSESAMVKQANCKKFADDINKEYPIDTKENAFMSSLHYATHVDDRAKRIVPLLKQACDFFDISEDVSRAIRELRAKNSDSSNQKYALNVSEDSLSNKFAKLLPINNVDEIERSADALTKAKSSIPLSFYYEACKGITDAWNSLPEEDKKYAFINQSILEDGTEYVLDADKIHELVDERVKSSSDQRYKMIKEFCEKETSPDQIDLQALRDVIYNIDLDVGLVDSYDNGIKNPYKFANSNLKLDTAIQIWKENVKIADVMIPLQIFSQDNILSAIPQLFSKDNSDQLLSAIKTASALKITDIVSEFSLADQRQLLNLINERS